MKNIDKKRKNHDLVNQSLGTSFEKYAIDNKFILDSKTFIEKKQGTARFSFAFIYENNTFGVWIDYKLGKIYVSNDYEKNTPFIFSTTLQDHSENTLFLKSARKYNCWKKLIENYEIGNVRFENQKIKNITEKLINKLIIS